MRFVSYLIVKDPPVFLERIYKIERGDLITADLENEIKGALLNNDIYLKNLAEGIQKKSNEHIGNAGLHVTAEDKQYWSSKAGTAVATQTSDGLQSAADKRKLDQVSSGAEVNQNAFAKVTSGNTTITANAKEATLILQAGNNVTIHADNATKKVTISAEKDNGNADTVDGHHASDFALAGHTHDGGKHLAGQGTGGGFSFAGDGAWDTGMFSDVDGDLYFMQNGAKWYAAHEGHTHDDRYYTEAEVNSLLNNKLSLGGGTLTGNLKVNTTLNAVNYQENGVVGHLVYIGSSAPSNTNMVWID